MNQSELLSLICAIATRLRADYEHSEYGMVILPFTVLRYLDCLLDPTKSVVLAELETRIGAGIYNPEPFLLRKTGGLPFCNTSPLDMKKLLGD
jgi:type I restriction enzyme M protein